MKILFIGGTGEISFDCIGRCIELGHDVSVFNRGNHNAELPQDCRFILGDLRNDDAYAKLGDEHFDAVCQFHVFDPDGVKRDLDTFKTDQYVFISTASAYLKPSPGQPITEQTPLTNPYWRYSQLKIECEAVLRQDSRLPWTIVRPSHTARRNFITPLGSDLYAARMLANKPVIVPGDGTSLWTATSALDFAIPFNNLLGNPDAIGEDFHITADDYHTWNDILQGIGKALNVEPRLVPVASETLIRYRANWAGPLLGDKSHCSVFDNSKVKRVAGDFTCRHGIEDIARRAAGYFDQAAHRPQYNEEDDALFDDIIREQNALGSD